MHAQVFEYPTVEGQARLIQKQDPKRGRGVGPEILGTSTEEVSSKPIFDVSAYVKEDPLEGFLDGPLSSFDERKEENEEECVAGAEGIEGDDNVLSYPLIGINQAHFVGLFTSQYSAGGQEGLAPQIYFEWLIGRDDTAGQVGALLCVL